MGADNLKPLTIGRLARAAGINTETVRFYERKGLLPKPPRGKSGYRYFPPDTTGRLKFIRRAQGFGFSLSEIRELLAIRMSSRTACAEVLKRTEAKIADIEGKIRRLDSIRTSLVWLVHRCRARASPSECAILETLSGEKG